MLDMLRAKSRTFGVYLVFAALIVIFAIGFGATPDGCGGTPGIFKNADFVDVDGETVDALTVRLASDISADTQNPRVRQADVSRFAGLRLYSPWSGARFGRGFDTASPVRLVKMTDDLIEQKLLASWARSLGLHVSPKELKDAMAAFLLEFTDEKTGQFVADGYRSWIQNRGVSTGAFENFVSDELLRERVIQLLVGEVGVSDAEIAQAHRLENEQVTVEHIVIDDASARAFVPVTDAEVATYVGANAERIQREYDAVRTARYTTPKTLTLRAIRISAADPSYATDDEQRTELEAERAAARERANQALAAYGAKVVAEEAPAAAFAEVAAQFSDHDSKDKGGLLGDVRLPALSEAPFHTTVGAAAAQLAPGTPSELIEAPGAFWILLADAITEETVTPLEQVRDELARALVQGEKVAEFKKGLAEEVFAEAQKDGTRPLADVVAAIHTKRNVSGALAVGTETFPRVRRVSQGIPPTSPFISAFGGRAPKLVAKAFAASADKPLIDELVNVDDGRTFVVARFLNKTPAPDLTEEEQTELRASLTWERRRALYRGWYEDLLAKKTQDGDIDTTSAYEEQKRTEEEAFVQGGGKLPAVAPSR